MGPDMHRDEWAFRSIATLMLQRIIALAVVCLILIGGIQVWLDRHQQDRQFFNTMSLIVETSSRAMAHAIWDIDRDVLLDYVQRLTEIEAVGFVRIQIAATGEVLEAGRAGMQQDVPSFQAVIHSPDEKSQALGSIEVWADRAYHRNLLWQSQKHVIPGYLIFTLLMCLMVAWVIRRDLGMPLRQIAQFVRHLKPETLNQTFDIRRPDRARSDEIDMVMQGFHHLQTALDRYIQDLDGLVQERTQALSASVEEVKRLSQLDALTGAYNRRAMELRLPMEIERSQRYQRPLSVIFIDIDHFKRINDLHGHAVGDAVLREVAQRLHAHLRVSVDWMVRFGGEEFVIFMPETDAQQAADAAQRLAQMVRSTPAQTGAGHLTLTCSFGVAQYRAGDSLEGWLEHADRALYQAKAQGRDRVCAAEV